MKIILTVVLIALIISVSENHAEILEVPLPGLHGTYPVDQTTAERTVSFQFDPPVAINSISFRVSGTTAVGALVCFYGDTSPWGMDLLASMNADGTGVWRSSEPMPMETGAFSWTAQFGSSPSQTPSWDFLLDGAGELRLFGGPLAVIAICSPVGPPPTAIVSEAVLVIDGEFAVPSEDSTWGRIKALYDH